MSIEVKHLIVKSTLVGESPDDNRREQPVDVERLKRQVIDECRKLIQQSLESRQER